MSNIQSLAKLAYKSLPNSKYRKIKNDPTKVAENTVLTDIRKDIMKDHRSLKQWASSAKIPLNAQYILLLMNHFTKPDFHNAINAIRSIQYDDKNTLYNFTNYWDEFRIYLNDKYYFNQTLSEHEQKKGWKKHHYIVQAVFYLLCYKRLNYIFKLNESFDEDDEGYFPNSFVQNIFKLEESDILPLIIYNIIDRTYDLKHLKDISL